MSGLCGDDDEVLANSITQDGKQSVPGSTVCPECGRTDFLTEVLISANTANKGRWYIRCENPVHPRSAMPFVAFSDGKPSNVKKATTRPFRAI